jgi:hypothetical protein
MVTQNVENTLQEQTKLRWIIDLGWYEQNHRSLFDLARHSLCTKCNEKLQKKKKKAVLADVLASIKDCCAKTPDYITRKLPIMESIFRILLANGNQPLDVEEMGKQLSERRGGDTHTTSPQLLTRLLSNDHWYGFHQVTEGENSKS